MQPNTSLFDTHGELLIQRYKQGIQLVEPELNHVRSKNSISAIYQLPISTYFMDARHHLVDANEVAVELVGRNSVNELHGRTAYDFWYKSFSDRIFANDDQVLDNKTLAIIEEEGFRNDDLHIQVMTFKFPWYYQDTVIGLLGLSIDAQANSLHEFANILVQLVATGLLNAEQSLAQILPRIQHHDIHLSKREIDILSYLVRGKTAKAIGECLSISKRTVEHHINNIKYKTRCSSKSELIDMFFDQYK